MIHALQKTEFKHLYSTNAFNVEFEARTIKALSGIPHGSWLGMENYVDFLENEYTFQDRLPNPDDLRMGGKFMNNYFENAKKYAQYNIEHNIGNAPYKEGTEQSPKVLIQLLLP